MNSPQLDLTMLPGWAHADRTALEQLAPKPTGTEDRKTSAAPESALENDASKEGETA